MKSVNKIIAFVKKGSIRLSDMNKKSFQRVIFWFQFTMWIVVISSMVLVVQSIYYKTKGVPVLYVLILIIIARGPLFKHNFQVVDTLFILYPLRCQDV